MAPLSRTLSIVEQGMAQRLHIGAQLYVSLWGQVVADVAVGEAQPGVAMTTETLMLWLSAGKPITAVAIAQLWEEGKLELDDPAARHIPEFAANGKQGITLRHLLTHTAGLHRVAASNWNLESWDQTIAGICSASPQSDWAPGRRAGYHVASSWFILGEIVRRLSDGTQPLEQYVRQRIFLPAGMQDTHLALAEQQCRQYGQRIGILHNTQGSQIRPHGWDTPEQASWPRPGASARGPIRELGRFYEMLLNRGRAPGRPGEPSSTTAIISPQSVEALTARHRTGMFDHTFSHVLDWGLGFLVNSAMYGVETVPYGYGPYASMRTFGHGGAQSSTGFCDPESGLVVSLVLNGTPGEARHQQRMRAILAAIYEDLGLDQ